MPLDEYRRKRNFSRSPEPSGDERLAKRRGDARQLFFCVQKHLASHLHYDFRLEHAGVLLSWAVPKGPSVDPADKRLAMQTEDHPLEYGTFEGVIPEGYGAGIVMLWDRGSWEPEVDDIDAAIRKGDLKFRLNGYKLKGSWVLVRTGGRYGAGDRRSWLLIKHRDDWSGPLDITDFAPLSVKSGGDFEDILAKGNPDIWRSNRPARGGTTGRMLERIIARAAEMKKAGGGREKEEGNGAGKKKLRRKGTSKKGASRNEKAKTGSGRKKAGGPTRRKAAGVATKGTRAGTGTTKRSTGARRKSR